MARPATPRRCIACGLEVGMMVPTGNALPPTAVFEPNEQYGAVVQSTFRCTKHMDAQPPFTLVEL